MRIYRGIRTGNGEAYVRVYPNGMSSKPEELSLRLDLAKHSPDGFEWGYSGSGPAQLALAILADATGDDVLAMKIYQDFKIQFVARLLQESEWLLSDEVVRIFVSSMRMIR